MKKTIKYIGSFFIAILTFSINAQTTTENHVVSKTYKVESQTSLNTQSPDSIATAIQYFDGIGRIKQSVMVKAGSGYGNNTVPYDWSVGNASQSSFYTIYGSGAENQIISGTTPFGHTDLLWECVNDASTGADGGFTTDYISVDTSKSYRYTLWIKRTGNLSDGVNYFGGGVLKNLDGTANSNPYFQIGDLPQIDTWYLMVGYVHPSNYTGTDLGISGVYDTGGNKVLDGTEYKWDDSVSDVRFNMYLVNATDTNTRQYLWSPVVQRIDGSEDTLNDIVNNPSVINNQVIEAKDIVTHFQYDGFGRQTEEYMPYASNGNNGSFNEYAKEDTHSYYVNKYPNDFAGVTDPLNANVFSEKILEETALNRPVEQTAPGLAWKESSTLVSGEEYSVGNTIKFNYDLNVPNEVRYYSVDITISGTTYLPSLVTSNFYDPGELTKTITKDENWSENQTNPLDRTTEEFKNKSGQVVLKRTYDANVAHDTYYVYDDYGNLSFVFPPKVDTSDGISANELSELSYQYIYDYRGRLVEKKIPGKGWEYIVYDKLDRPVLTQDALQRQSNKWLFTKYDALGRVAYTGEYVSSDSRTNIQTTVSSQSAFNSYEDTVTIAPTVMGGEDVYYSSRSFPNTTNLEVFTISYYDEYLDLPTGFTPPTTVYGESVTTQTKGLATVSKIRVLGTSNWITSVTYYDDKARPLYAYSENDYLQTTDVVESKLDFIGKVLETTTTHGKTGNSDIVTIDRFEYDHMDRLISQTQKVNDQTTERVARNYYDDLGQLKSKLTGNGTDRGYADVTSNVVINNDIITMSGGAAWTVGLATSGRFNSDGYVEFESTQTSKLYMVGLSSDNTNASYSTIDYAIYINGVTVRIYESSNNLGIHESNAVGDVFRVERIGDKIHYKKNGNTFYISSIASSGSLLGDVSFYSDGSEIKNLHIVDNSKGLQNVDYAYNIRGWLKNINEDTQSDNDLFDFTIRYNDPTAGGTALFNGNISQTAWNTASPVDPSNPNPISSSYDYTYDALNRIKSATDNTGNYNLTSISYDKNGNILTLQRKGHTNVSATLFGIMDNLSYTYDGGNKLTKVDEAGENNTGFKDLTGTDYTYDVNGNMISDGNKGISYINYNHLNLPTRVFFNAYQYIDYKYDATGAKLEKRVVDYSNVVTTYYAGNYIYEKPASGSTPIELQFTSHAEGYIKYENGNFDYVYQYKDHLGNIRLTYGDSNDDGNIDTSNEIIEESNYYPFGLKHKGYNNVVSSNGNSVAQKFKYNGTEFEESLGLNLYEMDLRSYDPAIGRFNGIDPITHHSQGTSVAFDNNPVFWADPSGADAQTDQEDRDRYDRFGMYIRPADRTSADDSGVATKNDEAKTITVESSLIFYGGEANNIDANKVAKEIEKSYNKNKTTITSNGTKYRVIFSIAAKVVSEEEAKKMAESNTDARINFIRVEQKSASVNRSKMQVGGNAGFWVTSDKLETSTTAAHEKGHGYGLSHPQWDQRGQGIPNIMVARGTIVDPQYQWNPKAAPGSYGGTVNPKYRQVLQSNIDLIFKNITFKNGKANLGRATNIIFDKNGNPI
jgi:RHS repeat-associated protein